MAILDYDKSVWVNALSEAVGPGNTPDILILEGTWWRARACDMRLGRLTEVTELAFPDMFVGRFGAARVAYCCAYGAARAVEPSHVFSQLGTPLIVQIGTCGVMSPRIPAGAVAVPRRAQARDGISQYYGAGEQVAFDAAWSDWAQAWLGEMGCNAMTTRHVTWPSLFAQSDAICAGWAKEGLETVDMEATAVAAVAQRFSSACVTLLTTWDLLAEGQTFLDPLPEESQADLEHANKMTFECALQLGVEVAGQRRFS